MIIQTRAIILDLALPDAPGIKVLTRLQQQGARVIVYSAYPKEKFAARAILGGARVRGEGVS